MHYHNSHKIQQLQRRHFKIVFVSSINRVYPIYLEQWNRRRQRNVRHHNLLDIIGDYKHETSCSRVCVKVNSEFGESSSCSFMKLNLKEEENIDRRMTHFFVRAFFVQYLVRTIHRHDLINFVCASLQLDSCPEFFFLENIVCRDTFYAVRVEASSAIAIIEICSCHSLSIKSNRNDVSRG